MATVTQVMLTCDMCGNAKDVQTRTFRVDGKAYEIDLCPKDGIDLDKVTARYISKARQATAKQAAARQRQRRGGRRPRLPVFRLGPRTGGRRSGWTESIQGR